MVFTQGRYLKTRPDTPVYERKYDPEFIQALEFCLDGLLFRQKLRRDKYGTDAEEWPPSHTPVELKERWEAEEEAEERRIQVLLEIPTPEDEPPLLQPPLKITRKRNLDDVSSSSNGCPNPAPLMTPTKRRSASSSCSTVGQDHKAFVGIHLECHRKQPSARRRLDC